MLQVELADAPGQPSNLTCLKAKLEEPLKAGSNIDVEWYSVHVGAMTPFPAQASQSDPQRVLLKGSAHVPSPYPISTQSTKVTLYSQCGNIQVITHAHLTPASNAGMQNACELCIASTPSSLMQHITSSTRPLLTVCC